MSIHDDDYKYLKRQVINAIKNSSYGSSDKLLNRITKKRNTAFGNGNIRRGFDFESLAVGFIVTGLLAQSIKMKNKQPKLRFTKCLHPEYKGNEWYDVLEVSPNANMREINSAHLKLKRKYDLIGNRSKIKDADKERLYCLNTAHNYAKFLKNPPNFFKDVFLALIGGIIATYSVHAFLSFEDRKKRDTEYWRQYYENTRGYYKDIEEPNYKNFISACEEYGSLWYTLLGLGSPNVNINDIEKAFRRKAMIYHPDKTGGDDTMFKCLVAAKDYGLGLLT